MANEGVWSLTFFGSGYASRAGKQFFQWTRYRFRRHYNANFIFFFEANLRAKSLLWKLASIHMKAKVAVITKTVAF